jgi:hypothetical protein
MATTFDISGLTLNPEEKKAFAEFIVERSLSLPLMNAIHDIVNGITVDERIVLAGLMGKSGLKGTGNCTPQSSGAKATMSEKTWTPKLIEDRLEHCQAEIDALFKAYYTKIRSAEQLFDISGTDEQKFVALLLSETIQPTVMRAAWLGDTGVAASGAATAGLKSAGNVKFYDYFEGLWEQIFTGVGTSSIAKITIDKNALTTTAAQTALDSDEAYLLMESIWAASDSRLKEDLSAVMMLTNGLWENYRKFLISKSQTFSIDITQNGLQTLDFNGKKVINMQNIWDKDLLADFEDNSTNHAYYLPNRAVFTVPSNIPIGFLNENDLKNIKFWYSEDDKVNRFEYGFKIDAKVIEDYLITVAY